MVAYTSPDCLAYFECTDSPCLNTGTACEPSTVFCDMAAGLETILNGFDATLARTGTGVPFAKVARSAPQVESILAGSIVFGFQVEWDTVLMDNANMVNLDADNLYVKINRPGIWWIELYMVGTPDTTTDNELNSWIVQRGGGSGFVPGTLLSEATSRWRFSSVPPNANTVQNRAAFAYQVSAADLAVNSTIDLGAVFQAHGTPSASGELTITYAEMTVYWTAESTV